VDGNGMVARFNIPWLLALDAQGRILAGELGNNAAVRVVVH
jgi:hypothetical protein